MTTHASSFPDTPLHVLVHDVQNCLHVVEMGLEILKGARGDDARFGEVSESMLRSNRRAMQLLNDYIRAAAVRSV